MITTSAATSIWKVHFDYHWRIQRCRQKKKKTAFVLATASEVQDLANLADGSWTWSSRHGECDNLIDPFTLEPPAESKVNDKITFVYRGKFECVNRISLINFLQLAEVGASWNFGDCEFVTDINGDLVPLEDTCKRFYKLLYRQRRQRSTGCDRLVIY